MPMVRPLCCCQWRGKSLHKEFSIRDDHCRPLATGSFSSSTFISVDFFRYFSSSSSQKKRRRRRAKSTVFTMMQNEIALQEWVRVSQWVLMDLLGASLPIAFRLVSSFLHIPLLSSLIPTYKIRLYVSFFSSHGLGLGLVKTINIIATTTKSSEKEKAVRTALHCTALVIRETSNDLAQSAACLLELLSWPLLLLVVHSWDLCLYTSLSMYWMYTATLKKKKLVHTHTHTIKISTHTGLANKVGSFVISFHSLLLVLQLCPRASYSLIFVSAFSATIKQAKRFLSLSFASLIPSFLSPEGFCQANHANKLFFIRSRLIIYSMMYTIVPSRPSSIQQGKIKLIQLI